MLNCVNPSSSRKPNVHISVPLQQAGLEEVTPSSSTQPSPTVNLTHEYNRYMQSNSYGEIWSKIHNIHQPNGHQEIIQVEEDQEELHNNVQILDPTQDCVEEVLQRAKPGTLTRLVSAYFEHSETTSSLCLDLLEKITKANSSYRDLHNLLDVLPLESDSDALSHAQCDRAFKVFVEFSNLDNPFPCPESHNFNAIRNCFSDLNQQLHHRLSRSRSRVHLVNRTTTCSAICLIGITIGVTIAAVVIASHALVSLVAVPLIPACLPSNITKNEVAHLSQLDAATRGTYVLHNELDTIDCLVESLFNAVEGDKVLIRLGLAMGCDRHPIYEVAKQLRKNHHNFRNQITDLEVHICLCIAAINKARSLLLKEMHLHQSDVS